jgi:two-component system alkaline phosphatase synthesis response regulator PhoP
MVTRDDLLDRVWGYEVLPPSRAVDELVARLRSRFEPDPEAPRYLLAVNGVGYRFDPDGARS